MARNGPQDAEQTFPGFLHEGLNMGDWILLFAPKPYLIVSTTEDYFSIDGARRVYQEAQRLYALYGAEERIGHQVGAGPHGIRQENREAIYRWFLRWFRNGEGDWREPAVEPPSPAELQCTETGQVVDSLGGETIFTLNRRRAADLVRPQRISDRAHLAAEVRRLAAIEIQPGGPPAPEAPGVFRVPEGEGRMPAILVVDPEADVDTLVRGGNVVLSIPLRGAPEKPLPERARLTGDYGLAMRAAVVGKTSVGLRAETIIRAVDYLAARPEVDPARITAQARGPAATVALLHAAAVDGRIRGVRLQDGWQSWRQAIDDVGQRGVYDVAVPGALRRYDLPDLLALTTAIE
jgi:hypothetical protein